MLNYSAKKNALKKLEETNVQYQKLYNLAIQEVVDLHNLRVKGIDLLHELEGYISNLANHPKNFDLKMGEIAIKCKTFEKKVLELEDESKKTETNVVKNGGSIALAGVGVAAFGPTAAMAIAMTFGTASTGTAIATLSGAAAMNAALAWLGGGTLAAGGAGIVGGEAILALMGPVGWTIGGVAFIGSGYLMNKNNKKVIRNAEESIQKILIENNRLRRITREVEELHKMSDRLMNQLNMELKAFLYKDKRDYHIFSNQDKEKLSTILNEAEILASKIGESVNV